MTRHQTTAEVMQESTRRLFGCLKKGRKLYILAEYGWKEWEDTHTCPRIVSQSAQEAFAIVNRNASIWGGWADTLGVLTR